MHVHVYRAAAVKQHLVNLTSKCEIMVVEEERLRLQEQCLERALSAEHENVHSYLISSQDELVSESCVCV